MKYAYVNSKQSFTIVNNRKIKHKIFFCGHFCVEICAKSEGGFEFHSQPPIFFWIKIISSLSRYVTVLMWFLFHIQYSVDGFGMGKKKHPIFIVLISLQFFDSKITDSPAINHCESIHKKCTILDLTVDVSEMRRMKLMLTIEVNG